MCRTDTDSNFNMKSLMQFLYISSEDKDDYEELVDFLKSFKKKMNGNQDFDVNDL